MHSVSDCGDGQDLTIGDHIYIGIVGQQIRRNEPKRGVFVGANCFAHYNWSIIDSVHRDGHASVCAASAAVTDRVGEAGCPVIVGGGDEANIAISLHAHGAIGGA